MQIVLTYLSIQTHTFSAITVLTFSIKNRIESSRNIEKIFLGKGSISILATKQGSCNFCLFEKFMILFGRAVSWWAKNAKKSTCYSYFVTFESHKSPKLLAWILRSKSPSITYVATSVFLWKFLFLHFWDLSTKKIAVILLLLFTIHMRLLTAILFLKNGFPVKVIILEAFVSKSNCRYGKQLLKLLIWIENNVLIKVNLLGLKILFV